MFVEETIPSLIVARVATGLAWAIASIAPVRTMFVTFIV